MSKCIYNSVAKTRFVINPSKYYTFEGEQIYYDPEKESLIHFDYDGKEIYRKGNFDLPYPCSYKAQDFNLDKMPDINAIHATDFSELFNKCSTYSDYLYEDIKRFMNTGKRGIVIGGCGRSGTTLLNSILGAHSKIHAIEEETYAFTPTPRLNRLCNIIDNIEENFWTEKTPKNINAFDFINQFNFIKLIHIVRDCRDVILSHHPNHEKKYWIEIERWNQDVQTALNYQDVCLTIKYEDLILKTQETLEKICEYVGLPFDSKMFEYQRHTNLKENVAWDQSASPLHSRSVNKWKTTSDKDRVNEVYDNNLSVSLLRKLKYEY